MTLAKLLSPAKVNLFLKVLSRRPDGFHNLYSLFQAVSLCDFITLELVKEDRIETTSPDIPNNASNLAMKAAIAFRQKLGDAFGVFIHIEKHIPVEAGLGGGSSNAATVLFGLNKLTGNPFSESELMQIGAEIGSDIPFFFSSGRAICHEKGAILKELEPISANAVLVKPAFGLKTKEVYQAFNQEKINSLNIKEIDELLLNKQYPFFNDLEIPAFALEPRLKTIKEELLYSGYDKVLMSGSGSSFICFGDEKEGPEFSWKFNCRFISRNKTSWY